MQSDACSEKKPLMALNGSPLSTGRNEAQRCKQ